MTTESILWRRLDTPGHDACRYTTGTSGWELDGTAIFLQERSPVLLSYHVEGDSAWRTRRGSVRGFVGNDAVVVEIERSATGVWTLNGAAVAGFEGHVHLDFGFTPATNYPQVRQLALVEGEAADLPVVWMDVPPGGLQLLPQHYERRTASTYWYEGPSVGYSGLLELTSTGLIKRYPGLWEIAA